MNQPSRRRGGDKPVWHFESHDRFSVRSAYQVTCCLWGVTKCSYTGRSWAFIWSSKARPKVVLFAWKCVLDALLITTQLQRQRVQVDDGCGGCLAEQEDVLHEQEDVHVFTAISPD
ncbi:UNVERIFIED_CONTAM: hypothetical protein Sradi_2668000 [Sesamum radiatum]|uniref:Reverse transcriptase zinc-binding domain-containing protein n=1 Tax=Sesamum radiatum TaxID=300843 RepID=A0AAW2S796_SESRA